MYSKTSTETEYFEKGFLNQHKRVLSLLFLFSVFSLFFFFGWCSIGDDDSDVSHGGAVQMRNSIVVFSFLV